LGHRSPWERCSSESKSGSSFSIFTYFFGCDLDTDFDFDVQMVLETVDSRPAHTLTAAPTSSKDPQMNRIHFFPAVTSV